MSIYRALRAYLLADPAIAGVVATRIYPIRLPQGATFPAITIQRVSGFRQGVLLGRASLARPRYQIDAWTHVRSGASAYDEAQVLGGLILDRLEGYTGTMTDAQTSPVTVYQTAVEFITDQELYEEGVDGGWYRHSSDFYVWHST